jgi:hypothetical protein
LPCERFVRICLPGEENEMNGRERRVVVLVMAVSAAFGAWLIWFNPEHMNFVCQEDGFVEYSEAFLYLWAAGVFAYIGARKGFRNIWYWGYAALFLLVCGEEVSWGQRIFSIATPTPLAAINVQGEISLHNLDGVHQHHHLYGMLVCATICFVIPLTNRFMPAMRRLYARFNMPVYPLWTWSLAFIGFAFFIVPRVIYAQNFKYDEMGEFYMAMAFFGFALSAYTDARRKFGRPAIRLPEPERMLRAA